MANEFGFALGNALQTGYGTYEHSLDRKARRQQLEQEAQREQARNELEAMVAHLRANTDLKQTELQHTNRLGEIKAGSDAKLAEWQRLQAATKADRDKLLADFENDPATAGLSPKARDQFRLRLLYGDTWPAQKPISVSPGETLYDPDSQEPVFSGQPKSPSGGDLDSQFQALQTKRNMKQPLTPEEQATYDAYKQRKTIVPETTFNMNSGGKSDARLDRSYQQANSQLEKLRKPVSDQSERLARLNDSIEQGTPQADALVAPELLTAMAGGAGSGLRMNEAEIARIVGGRSQWQTLQATLQQWSTDPKKANSITPEQRRQIRALVGAVKKRVDSKLSTLDDAAQGLIDAPDVDTHRRLLGDVAKKLTAANVTAGPESGARSDGSSGTVRMKRPNGRQAIEVPADQVEHYKKLGAVVVP